MSQGRRTSPHREKLQATKQSRSKDARKKCARSAGSLSEKAHLERLLKAYIGEDFSAPASTTTDQSPSIDPGERRRALLVRLDSAVWVEKRLFPARLLVLDEIDGGNLSSALIMEVVKRLCGPESDSVYRGKNLVDLVIESRGVAGALSYGCIPRTAVEQFVSDLNTYGLREALAYLAGEELFTPDLEAYVISGYEAIGQRFLRHADKIKERFGRQARSTRRDGVPTAIIDRLVVAEILSFGGPWKDGQDQRSFAKLT
ncbi:MAG: hypothetical protein ABSE73_01105 [Planctomycetota bacterium]